MGQLGFQRGAMAQRMVECWPRSGADVRIMLASLIVWASIGRDVVPGGSPHLLLLYFHFSFLVLFYYIFNKSFNHCLLFSSVLIFSTFSCKISWVHSLSWNFTVTADFSSSERATLKYPTPAVQKLNSYAPALGESQRELSHKGKEKIICFYKSHNSC